MRNVDKEDVASISLQCGFRLECLHLGLHGCEKAAAILRLSTKP